MRNIYLSVMEDGKVKRCAVRQRNQQVFVEVGDQLMVVLVPWRDSSLLQSLKLLLEEEEWGRETTESKHTNTN